MPKRKSKKSSLDQLLKLAEQLSPDERDELRRKLNTKSWGDRWDALTQRVRKRVEKFGPMSDEEIVAEMKAIKQEVWSKRAEGPPPAVP